MAAMGSSNVPFVPGSAAIPATEVEISISCRGLMDKDIMSKSDPMCILFSRDFKSGQYHEFARTEMIKDCLNPDFVKKFLMQYLFEESQKLRFEVYDVDSPSSRLDAHDFLGRLECTLGEIVGAPNGKLEKTLQGIHGTNSKICLRAEEISKCKDLIHLHFKATKLDKKDFLGKSDPFLQISRANEDQSYSVVHRTEYIKRTLNPTWRAFSITSRALCNGDQDRSIKIETIDYDSDGGHDTIGEFYTNLRTLLKGAGSSNQYPVINVRKKAKKKKYKSSGEVQLISCRSEPQPSFLDFIKGGTQMGFTVAVDFTASNGNPTNPSSLHYLSPNQPNQYASALQAVGDIIQDYDSDKLFPALGFGAKLPDGLISHEFALNFNPSNPYCVGIPGVLQAYYQAIQRVQLYGPTNFSPVINHVAKFASACRDGTNYFVLLIITDGVITDMHQTVDAIVHAAKLPMSIIIVGVGNAEFDAMHQLDGDEERLHSGNQYAERDIVQFVPFRDFIGKYGNNMMLSQAYLAKEVLAEIPDQFLSYMKNNRISPRPPQQISVSNAPSQQINAPNAPPR